MLRRLQERQPGSPIYRILWWYLYHALTFYWFVPCYRYRSWGGRNIPDTGPVLLLSNHQSFLDPIIVGLGGHKRQFHPLARKTLWDSALYRALTVPMNPIPVDQENEAGDIKAMKACIEQLKNDQAVLVYPEGSRSDDGATGEFQPGTMLLIKRAKPTVIPVALEGSFDAWPKERKLPKLRGRIGCMYGDPIRSEDLLAMGNDAAIRHLRNTVEAMRLELRERLDRL